MVGIKVTQEILDKNNVSYPLGSIQILNTYPKRFYVTENVVGGYQFRTDLHEVDGWKPFENPTFDQRTQYLGDYVEEPTRFTKEVLNKTQEQIDAYDQAQLDADEHASKIEERREDGYTYYYRIMSLVERAWRNGQITTVVANAANTYFDDALSPLLRGNWQSSNTKLAVPPSTSNQAFLNTYNNVKTYVENYVTQTYI